MIRPIDEIIIKRGDHVLIYRPHPEADYYEIIGNFQGAPGEFGFRQQEEEKEEHDG